MNGDDEPPSRLEAMTFVSGVTNGGVMGLKFQRRSLTEIVEIDWIVRVDLR